jgi:hypothetical protein
MLVIANGRKIELDYPDSDSIIKALNAIFKDLYNNNEIVQEVVIDGRTYREDYNVELLNNTMNIKEVKINTVSGDALAQDIAAELRDYLPRLIRAFDSISELFYGEMNQDDWGYFGQLTEGMQWVMQSVHVLRVHAERFGANADDLSVLTAFSAEAEKRLTELEEAIRSKDYTAAGDMLKYEFPELFQPLMELKMHA